MWQGCESIAGLGRAGFGKIGGEGGGCELIVHTFFSMEFRNFRAREVCKIDGVKMNVFNPAHDGIRVDGEELAPFPLLSFVYSSKRESYHFSRSALSQCFYEHYPVLEGFGE